MPIAIALEGASSGGGSSVSAPMLAFLVAAAAIGAIFATSVWLRRSRAQRADGLIHGDFSAFVLAALANAAKLDGAITDVERAAIADAMKEVSSSGSDHAEIEAALARATLSKNELVAYLQEHGAVFSHDQKVLLLKLLVSVFVADELFDEGEHQALIDYTTALGFDRQSAPGRLRGLVSDLARGRMVT